MNFESKELMEVFAEFVREKIRNLGIPIEEVAHRAAVNERTIYSYLNPDQEQGAGRLTEKFYLKMQKALQFKHEDFRKYYEERHLDQSTNMIGNLNISGGTFEKIVFGAKDVHFHDSKGDSGD